MDVTKPVLCVSSLKDLTLSELVQWLDDYRNQVDKWALRCREDDPDEDYLRRCLEDFSTALNGAYHEALCVEQHCLSVARKAAGV